MFLNQRASFLLGTVAAVALAAAGSDVRADQINVSAIITASCSVADLDFGAYDSAVDSETTTTLNITCTAPADVGVTLDNGMNPNGSRRMKHASEDQFLGYLLFDGDPSGAISWTSQEKTVDVGEGGAQVLIGGRIAATQTGKPSGSYTDVVQVTLDVK
jgi:spore coat protein U-like protein